MTSQTFTPDLAIAAPRRRAASRAVRGFWIGAGATLSFLLVASHPAETADYAPFLILFACAVLPVYLWMSGRAPGLPIFPVFAVSTILPFAFPLISGTAPLDRFDTGERFTAAFKIAIALVGGTFVWLAVLRRPHKVRRRQLVIDDRRADRLFTGAVAFAAVFSMLVTGGWLPPFGGATGAILGIFLSLNSIGSFVMGLRWGQGKLPPRRELMFAIAFTLYLLTTISSLLLIGAMTVCALFVTGYSIGRHRVPWRWIALAMVAFTILHIGKGRMRDRYWYGRGDAGIVRPWEYGSFLKDWVGEAMTPDDTDHETSQTILDRAGLLHLFLMVQHDSPETVPYLSGATYRILPQLMIPRFFNPRKIASHEGTYMLNVHYGLQRREDTIRTTIAWGLVNEANANFGFAGVVGLFIFFAIAYGSAARWARDMPALSFPSLAALVLLSMAVQTEFTAGVYFNTLLQSVASLALIRVLFMRWRRADTDSVAGTHSSSIRM